MAINNTSSSQLNTSSGSHLSNWIMVHPLERDQLCCDVALVRKQDQDLQFEISEKIQYPSAERAETCQPLTPSFLSLLPSIPHSQSLKLYTLQQRYLMNQEHTQPTSQSLYAGIELGGTNYSVAIAEPVLDTTGGIADFKIIKRTNGITYQSPTQSLEEIIAFLKNSQQSQGKKQFEYEFIGIASFGPLCLNRNNPLYGSITTTPKELWRGVKVLQTVQQAFGQAKAGIDTDVNSAAYAEFKLGKHAAQESLAYITVGTGVGVGVIAQGKTIHGLTHPEGGHIIVERAKDQYEHFRGVCPFHREQTCLEGMVSNKSIAERLKINFTALQEVPDDSDVWRLVAFYLAQLCLNITLLISPEVIVIGGGVMNRKLLFGLIHKEFIRLLSGYVDHPLLSSNISEYIVAPRLGGEVGVKGAMILSQLQ